VKPDQPEAADRTTAAEPQPTSPRRFVPRDEIAQAAAALPRIDAGRFRADVDALVDQDVDIRSTGRPASRRTCSPRTV